MNIRKLNNIIVPSFILQNHRVRTVFCCIIVLFISYFTYFHDYYKPDKAFFDEHYYVIQAERYIYRIVSFDGNPPLGKMFMALGELLFHPNKELDIKNRLESGAVFFNKTTSDFSFVGVRFFPSLFGILNGLLLFMIFYKLSRNNLLSLLLSSLYLFENSSIVHFRAAMLDSTLIFFSLLTVFYFIVLYENKKENTLKSYFIFGCVSGLAVSTKLIGVVLTVLFFFLLFKELKGRISLKKVIVYFSSLILMFFTIYYVHIALGAKVLKGPLYTDLNTQVYEYDASYKSKTGPSKEYMKMIDDGDIYNPLKMYIPIKSYFIHMVTVQSVVPKEDPTLISSSPLLWPIGMGNITYLTLSAFSYDQRDYQYLSFQGNPVNWALGIIAVLASVVLILASSVFRLKISEMRLYKYLFVFTSLYVSYMIAVVIISTKRALYLHTYLFPLFLSFILVLLIFSYLFEQQIIRRDRLFYITLSFMVGLIFYTYFYTYSYIYPFTSAKGQSYLECEESRLVYFWEDWCQR